MRRSCLSNVVTVACVKRHGHNYINYKQCTYLKFSIFFVSSLTSNVKNWDKGHFIDAFSVTDS